MDYRPIFSFLVFFAISAFIVSVYFLTDKALNLKTEIDQLNKFAQGGSSTSLSALMLNNPELKKKIKRNL